MDRIADNPTSLTRRQALKTVAGSSLLLLLPMLPAFAQAKDQWTNVGKPADFALNEPKKVTLDSGAAIFVTRTDAKTFAAITSKCTHHGCSVDWKADDKQFECPCHGAAFAKDGKNIHGPRRTPTLGLDPLAALPIRQQGANVQVNFGAVAPSVVMPR